MFTSERHQEIILALKAQGKVKVKELSQKYSVSEDLIRKDLKQLENKGFCKREYGGAVNLIAHTEINVAHRKNTFTKEKKEIAYKAFDLIKENETIFLDISTTNIALAEILAKSNKKCTIITNMIAILQILSTNPNLKVIALGGMMSREQDGFIGSITLNALERYYFDRCFIGCSGINFKISKALTLEIDDALIKELAIKNSTNSYLLAYESKFNKDGICRFAKLTDFSAIITNNELQPKNKKILLENKIKYI